jgi:hypothetical protein
MTGGPAAAPALEAAALVLPLLMQFALGPNPSADCFREGFGTHQNHLLLQCACRWLVQSLQPFSHNVMQLCWKAHSSLKTCT